MNKPPQRLSPIGFWSYARQDDEASGGRLSQLRVQLGRELQLRYGKERVQIWQDVRAIPPGSRWEEEIDKGIAESTFFIPIITPAFIESEYCCLEVQKFLEREREIRTAHPEVSTRGRIFPLLYIDATDSDPADPEAIETLFKIQFKDFTALQLNDPNALEVKTGLVDLSKELASLLKIKVAPLPTVAEIEQSRRDEAKRLKQEQRREQELEAERIAQQERDAEASRIAEETRQAQEAEQQRVKEEEDLRRAEEAEARERERLRIAQEAEAARKASEDRIRQERVAREEAARLARQAKAEQLTAWFKANGKLVALSIVGLMVAIALVWTLSRSSAEAPDEVIANPPVTAPAEPEEAPGEWMVGEWVIDQNRFGCTKRMHITRGSSESELVFTNPDAGVGGSDSFTLDSAGRLNTSSWTYTRLANGKLERRSLEDGGETEELSICAQ